MLSHVCTDLIVEVHFNFEEVLDVVAVVVIVVVDAVVLVVVDAADVVVVLVAVVDIPAFSKVDVYLEPFVSLHTVWEPAFT